MQSCTISMAHFSISIIQFHVPTTLSPWIKLRRENGEKTVVEEKWAVLKRFLCTYLKSDPHSHAEDEIFRVTN